MPLEHPEDFTQGLPRKKENPNPVCEICFLEHKTSQHNELTPKAKVKEVLDKKPKEERFLNK